MSILIAPSFNDFDDTSASSNGEELQRLIDQKLLTPVFQPIIDLDHHSILGFEALTRGPKDSPLAQPNELFAAAVSNKQLAALEYACREAACTAFARMDLPGKLFLNMTPLSFTDSQYRDGVTLGLLRQLNINPERVVFELTEKHPLEDFILLRGACDHFKRQGFAVAIDDLGAGYAGLRVWSELNPHYVKIDQHFIRDIDSNPTKREFVRAMLDIALRIGNKVIAEGVETEDELRTLVAMGVQYVQGFYLARPHAEPLKEVPVHIKDLPLSLMPQPGDIFHRKLRDVTVAEKSITPDISAERVIEMFRKDSRLNGIPIVSNNKALGMVSRSELLDRFSLRFSYELNGKQPIANFISSRSLILDIDHNLGAAGRVIAEDPAQNLNVDIIVCENIGTDKEIYVGVAKVRSILAAIADEKLRAARHSNPLTLLPGNVPLYEWIDQLLCSRREFVVAYFDINQFKPFNDAFGYSRGDEVIILLGRLLQIHIDVGKDFIGHVGGDDFVVAFCSQDWQVRCERTLDAFAKAINDMTPSDQHQYWAEDREGRRRRYGTLTLAVGCIQPDPDLCRTHHHVAMLLADAKHQAKEMKGNQLFVSRRRGPAATSAVKS